MFPELILASMEPDQPFDDVLPASVKVLAADDSEQRLLVSVEPPLPVYFGEHEGYEAQFFVLFPRHQSGSLTPVPDLPVTVYFHAIITDDVPTFSTLPMYPVVSIGYGSLRLGPEVIE
jgi:hypothetical protein